MHYGANRQQYQYNQGTVANGILEIGKADVVRPPDIRRPRPTRDWKIVITDTGYQIPTVFYRPNTVILKYRGIRLPT